MFICQCDIHGSCFLLSKLPILFSSVIGSPVEESLRELLLRLSRVPVSLLRFLISIPGFHRLSGKFPVVAFCKWMQEEEAEEGDNWSLTCVHFSVIPRRCLWIH